MTGAAVLKTKNCGANELCAPQHTCVYLFICAGTFDTFPQWKQTTNSIYFVVETLLGFHLIVIIQRELKIVHLFIAIAIFPTIILVPEKVMKDQEKNAYAFAGNIYCFIWNRLQLQRFVHEMKHIKYCETWNANEKQLLRFCRL